MGTDLHVCGRTLPRRNRLARRGSVGLSHVSQSLGEIEALAKRAARGAGYSWGLAEEVGFATRWLCRFGLPGAEKAEHLLTAFDRGEVFPPVVCGAVLQAKGAAPLCPIQTGAYLADIGVLEAMEIHQLSEPLLILPFAALATRHANQPIGKRPIKVIWGNFVAITNGTDLSISGKDQDITCAQNVLIRHVQDQPQSMPNQTRSNASPACLEILNRLAHRTYAPATDESRNRGAGAGGSDND